MVELHGNIDEELYSRQLYVLGHEGMKKMQQATALIIGIDGLGQEIVKNIALAGIGKIYIYDNTPVTICDLSAGFYFSQEDIGKPKGKSVVNKLLSINKHTKIELVPKLTTYDYDIIIAVNQELEENIKLNEQIRSHSKFVMVNSRGFFGQLFVDFNSYMCLDKNGGSLSSGLINEIVQSNDEYIVFLPDGIKHHLDKDDMVKIHIKSKNSQKNYLCTVTKVENYKEFWVKFKTPVNDIIYSSNTATTIEYEQQHVSCPIVHVSLKNALSNLQKIVKYEYTNEDQLHRLFGNIPGDIDQELQDEFNRSKDLLTAPLCSIFGGFAAQEILKGLSRKFIPLNQLFYYHAQGLYVSNNQNIDDSRYKSYISLLGEDAFQKISKAKVFLVGAGAIGCENIKNFIMCGIGSQGTIFITDMDSIEKSNLNRQFLFKENDIGKPKSECAAKNSIVINPDYENKIQFMTHPIKEETETIFSDVFIENIDVVSNALDNVQARLYMDERCVQLDKGMVDTGTMGTKGHVQVIIPGVTESYSSTIDPEEESIPLCTIKSYPNTIEHTIEWAMNQFKVEFEENPEEDSTEDLEIKKSYELEEIVSYALNLFDIHFNKDIDKLLTTFPPNYITKEGFPFWVPPKRIPHPLKFDKHDEMHVLFVLTTVKLYCQANTIPFDEKNINNLLDNTLSTCKNINFKLYKNEIIKFEKDSWHADFIYAASNLRARNYDIKEKSKHFIIGVAGKIIPAIATTTAVVSGLATIEIIKIILKKKNVKNSFLELAQSMICNTDPIACPKLTYKNNLTGQTIEYTLWDKKHISDKTLDQIIKELKTYYGDDISMINNGSKILYWNMSEKYKKNLKKTIKDLLGQKDGQKYAYLTVITECNDEDKEIVQVIL